jgi:hypothetical protein
MMMIAPATERPLKENGRINVRKSPSMVGGGSLGLGIVEAELKREGKKEGSRGRTAAAKYNRKKRKCVAGCL